MQSVVFMKMSWFFILILATIFQQTKSQGGPSPRCSHPYFGNNDGDPNGDEVPTVGSFAGSFPIGSTFEVTCHDCFTSLGSPTYTVTCTSTSNGVQWTGTANPCQRVTCQPPQQVNNANLTILPPFSGIFFCDVQVQYECHPGTELTGGELNTTCTQGNTVTGHWDPDFPICTGIPCFPVVKDVDHGMFKPEGPHLAVDTPTVTYTCDSGFLLNGPNQINCNITGQWDIDELPTCVAIVCPELTAPDHGTVSHFGFNIDDVALYKCNAGYEITSGDETRTCELNTNNITAAWSGNPVVCSDINECNDTDVTNDCGTNADCENLEPANNVAMSKFDCTCREGFTGDPFVECLEIDECDDAICCGNCTEPSVGTFLCTCNPGFTGPGCCTPIQCPIPDPLPNGSVEIESIGVAGTAEYECNVGFEITSGSANITCDETGQWNPSGVPVCTIISCGQPEPGDNADSQITPDTNYEGRVNYVCRSGYEWSSGNFDRWCQADGTWTGEALNCTAIECVDPYNITNGNFAPPEGPYFGYLSSTITYTCDAGYELDAGTDVLVCIGPEWDRDPPVCERISCGPPPPFANGIIDGDEYLFEDVITYECNCGYQLVGNEERTCQADKTWSGVAPTCTDIDECNEDHFCDCHENADCTNLVPTADNDYQKYECKCRAGFEGDGHTLGNGTGCTEVGMCDQGLCCDEGTYKCIEGKPGYYYCKCKCGWTGKHCCTPITCPKPKGCGYASYTPVQDSYPCGSIITYSCYDGFKLYGGATTYTRKCGCDTYWSGYNPVCKRYYCDDPGQGVYAKRYSYSRYFKIGSYVKYKCLYGYYKVSGDYKLKCGYDGYWSGSPLECGPKQCKDPGDGYYADRTGNDFTKGGIVTYKCKYGYYSPYDPHSIECLCGGYWSGRPLKCYKIYCRKPKKGVCADYEVVDKNYAYGGVVKYTCWKGYYLKYGSYERYCLKDGTWDGKRAICYKVKCDPPDYVKYGYYYPKEDYYYYGDTVVYKCIKGYKCDYVTLTCGYNGEWDNEPPVCGPVTCYDPPVGDYSYHSSSGPYYYGDCVSYYCKYGYYCGAESVTSCCGYYGKWTEPPPKCRDLNECLYDNMNDCHENATCINYNYKIDGKGFDCKCNPGHEGNGHTTDNYGVNGTGCDDIGECLDKPCKHGDCYEPKPNMFRCKCYYGYHGYHCDKRVYCKPPRYGIYSDYVDKKDKYYYGENITYSCKYGYKTHKPLNPIRTCGHYGKWSGDPWCCYPICCDKPEKGIYARLIGKDWCYKDVIKYVCKRGYKFYGDGDLERTCQIDGTWSGSAPECKPLTCGTPPDCPYATYTVSDPNYGYYTKVKYRCIPGYYCSDTTVMYCRSNCEYSGYCPKCKAIKCPPLDAPYCGYKVGDGYYYGDMIEFGCNYGYYLKGEPKLTCGKYGKWDYDRPKCKDINECAYDYLNDCHDYAYCVNYDPKRDKYNRKYKCYCKPGYYGDGLTTGSGCLDIGECLKKPCGDYGDCTEPYPNHYYCKCHEGYYGKHCDRRRKCDKPDYGINCAPSAYKDYYYYGDTCHYKCREGYYYHRGDEYRTCGKDGKFSGYQYCCKPVVCPCPGNGENAIKIGRDYYYKKCIKYVCKKGYKLYSGSLKICCDGYGKWDGEPPVCKPIYCGEPDDGECSTKQVTHYYYGGIATYSCDHCCCYDINPWRIYCGYDGKWSGGPLNCHPVKCGYPGDSYNAIQTGYSYYCGDVISYKCKYGYYFYDYNYKYDSYNITCKPNGKWDSRVPHCKPKRCDKPDSIDKGYFYPYAEYYYYKNQVTYKCKKGYYMVDPENRVLTCQYDGEWDKEPPTCNRTKCYEPPKGKYCTYTPGEFYYGDYVTYHCDHNYYCDTHALRIPCREDGTYPPAPVCGNLNECLYDEYNDCHENATCVDKDPYVDHIPYACICKKGHDGNGHTSDCEYWKGEGCTYLGHCTPSPCDHGTCIEKYDKYTCHCDKGYYRSHCNKRRYCKTPRRGVYSHMTPKQDYYYCGDSIYYKCKDGYVPHSGDATRTCGYDGYWTGDPLCCHKVTCKKPDKGKYCKRQGSDYDVGGVVTYKCRYGYCHKDGDLERVCLPTGYWSGYAPNCGPCECPPPDHCDYCDYYGSDYTYKGVIKYKCHEGYYSDDKMESYCRGNRRWKYPCPVCKRKCCYPIRYIEYGEVEGEDYCYGDTLQFNCKCGYKLVGAYELKCLYKGWDNRPPKCVDVNECKDDYLNDCDEKAICINLVPHEDPLYRGYKCVCKYGYEGDGHTSNPGCSGCTDIEECKLKPCCHGECIEKYRGGFVCKCEPGWKGHKCCTPIRCKKPKKGRYCDYSVDKSKNYYDYGEEVYYTCYDGYYLYKGDLHRKCDYNGVFTGYAAYCKDHRCPNPGKGKNAYLPSYEKYYKYGAEVWYQCKYGYYLKSGSLHLKCGKDRKWDNDPPVCVAKKCDRPPDGTCSHWVGNDWYVGSKVTYYCNKCCECDEPWVITCECDGTWSAGPLHCKKVTCGYPGDGLNSYCDDEKYDCGDTITYYCDYGCYMYNKQTKYSITCGEDGQWSDYPPDCHMPSTKVYTKPTPKPHYTRPPYIPYYPEPQPEPQPYKPYPGPPKPQCKYDSDCCQHAQCIDGQCSCETGYSGDGKYTCKNECVCRVRGDPYIDDYDGNFCIFPVTATDTEYLLTKYVDSYGKCSFKVILMTSHPLVKGATLWGADMPRYIDIYFAGLVMRFDQDMKMSIDGKYCNLPYAGAGFTVEKAGNFVILNAQKSCGILVGFEGIGLSSVVTIKVPSDFGDSLYGMCGNCDGHRDMRSCDGDDITDAPDSCGLLTESCTLP